MKNSHSAEKGHVCIVEFAVARNFVVGNVYFTQKENHLMELAGTVVRLPTFLSKIGFKNCYKT